MAVWKKYNSIQTDTYTEVIKTGGQSAGMNQTNPYAIAHENQFGTDLHLSWSMGYVFDSTTGQFTLITPVSGTYMQGYNAGVFEYGQNAYYVQGDSKMSLYKGYNGEYAGSLYFKNMHTSTKTTTYSIGSYLMDVQDSNASAYPDNGRHTDGYWYVKQDYDVGTQDSTSNSPFGKFYVDINGINKLVRRMYVNIAGINKKARKLYANINGYWRAIMGGKLVYRGRGIVSLSGSRSNLTGAANKNYAFYFGGTGAWNNSSASTKAVDAISEDLVRYTAPELSYAQYGVQCGSIGEYAITSEEYGYRLYSYDGDLTKTLIRNIYSDDNMYTTGSGVNTKDYVVFPLRYNSATNQLLVLDEDLTIRRVDTGGFKPTNYNVSFLGNVIFQETNYWSNGTVNTLYVMDNDFTITLLGAKLRSLYGNTRSAAKATVGRNCIFAGGTVDEYDEENGTYSSYVRWVDILNDDWTMSQGVDLSTSGYGSVLAASMEGFAIFAFGFRRRAIRAYDDDLTIVMQTTNDYGRSDTVPVVIGKQALFAGGRTTYQNQAYDDESNSIDVFTIQ